MGKTKPHLEDGIPFNVLQPFDKDILRTKDKNQKCSNKAWENVTILTILNKEAEYKRFRATKCTFIKLNVSNSLPVGTRYFQCHFLTIMNSRLYIAGHQNVLYCAKSCLNNIENFHKNKQADVTFL